MLAMSGPFVKFDLVPPLVKSVKTVILDNPPKLSVLTEMTEVTGPKTWSQTGRGHPKIVFEIVSGGYGLVTWRRMNRAGAEGTGMVSRTWSSDGVFVSVTVKGGPKFHV